MTGRSRSSASRRRNPGKPAAPVLTGWARAVGDEEDGDSREPHVYTVAEITRRIKELLETGFPAVWVQGEVSNFTRAASGHLYFTLKDEHAQLKAVMWRSRAVRLRFELHDGLDVVAAGPLEVYEPRGTYQLIVEEIVPRGLGPLELAFRQLCEKLAAEGLFDQARKRPLPLVPRRVAMVTSPAGAALRDMLQVTRRRWPAARIVIVPTAVQGAGAAAEIAAALRVAASLEDVDVIITGRGGGSLEDLWAFNEEIVARAIYASPVPVVSAVGHEVDVSIADLVADRRALTPSEAAEIVFPDCRDMSARLAHLGRRLASAVHRRLNEARIRLDSLSSRRVLSRPLDRIHDLATRLDELDVRLRQAVSRRLERGRHDVAKLAASLDALSPLKVLERGYSLTRRHPEGTIVRHAEDVRPGDRIETLLSRGRLTSRVENVETASSITSEGHSPSHSARIDAPDDGE